MEETTENVQQTHQGEDVTRYTGQQQPGTALVQQPQQQSGTGFVLARIKPYNKRVGLTIKTYTYKGYRFREENGWYKVPQWLGEELKELAVDDNDPNSPYLFDVLGEAEAQALDERERKRRERATANRPNQTPDIRRGSTRRIAAATQAAQTQAATGVVTTASLRPPNDEVIPNGYPPARSYPMPQHGGVPQVSQNVAVAVETGHEDEGDDFIDSALEAGVPDKVLQANSRNLTRDMNGGAPTLIDGEGDVEDEEVSLQGSTDFGRDDPAVREHDPDAPVSPPTARRRRRG